MKKLNKFIIFIVFAIASISLFACAATTKKGTQCKRPPSPGSEYCWQHGGTTKAQRAAGITAEEGRCKATTKAGTQCKRNAQAGSQFCWQHASSDGDMSEKKSETNISTNPEVDHEALKEIRASQKCTATTKKGTPCTRKAQPGTNKCWQHGQ